MMRWDTPVGSFEIEIGNHGVTRVSLADGALEQVPSDLAGPLNEHLHGRDGSLRLDLDGQAPLAQVALAKLLEIPFGEVRSYAWIAKEIGRPAAIRPVANAVAGNPIPLLIPCHRVIRSDGHIGEFSLGGPHVKRALLQFEGVDVAELERLASHGVRFLADDKGHIFHLPSCSKSPKSGDRATIELRTAESAREKGFDACRSCRPI